MLFDLKKVCVQRLKFKAAFFFIVQESSCIADNYVVFHRSVVVKLHVATEDFMSENYRCLFHSEGFSFFPFVS